MFIFSGLMMAVAGIAYTGMLSSAIPLAFQGLEMKLIAMAVIGGASLKGGQGTVPGALLGLLLITLIGNSMTIIGISPQWEGAILGSILVAASILDVYVQKKVE
jgi:ribose transport system permease protein